ncbi:hypothetical protein Pmani_019308 [Petrolisthes manimaculis]|uniref:DOMON domain-containing protein n=1 Tax=Petrolisthes manimaculis TaxID=1843537 RepID=A0AAE1U7T8_9EUCA|nr:hypothetical protein Pmani_019308 [Petrolisthes manimaculis]
MAGCGSVWWWWCVLVMCVVLTTATPNNPLATLVSRLFQDIPALKFTIFNSRQQQQQQQHSSTQRSGRNYGVLPRLCYGELGCLETGPDFLHQEYRSYNMEPNSRQQINVMFHVRSRQDPSGVLVRGTELSQVLTSTSFKPDRPTKIIIHGFLNGRDMPWLEVIGDEYLKVQDVNVVYVDWTDGSLAIYSQAVANTRVAGLEVAHFINWLQENTGLSPSTVHIIGHSLGSHVAGYAGERVIGLGRISGLDPAEPFFQFMPPAVRLDPSDANFVDVIHTDAGQFSLSGGYGLLQPVGHVDFYPNGGKQQTGCEQSPTPPLFALLSDSNILRGVEDSLGCNHMRAVTLFRDSITSTCPYLAFKCPSYSDFLKGACFRCDGDEAGCASMGEEANTWADNWQPNSVQQMYLSTGPPSSLCLYHYKLRVNVGPGEAGCGTRGSLNVNFITPQYTGKFTITNRIYEGDKPYTFTLEYKHDLGVSEGVVVTWDPHQGVDSPSCRINYNAALPITSLTLTNIEVTLYSRRRSGRSQGTPSEITICPPGNKRVAWVRSGESLRMYPCISTTINTSTPTGPLVLPHFANTIILINARNKSTESVRGMMLLLLVVCVLSGGWVEGTHLDDNHLHHHQPLDLSALPAYLPSTTTPTHQSVLDSDGAFTVFWTPDLQKNEVIWEIHARTLGWIGFGFSSNGNMAGSDFLTAWIEDGQLHLQDRYGTGETLPPLDDHADWRPLYAHENDTHTVLVVARDINTCDSQDYPLTNDSVRLMYAWSDTDPVDGNLYYHGPHRGSKYAFVLVPFYRQDLPQDADVWTISQSIKMPHLQETFYWCHVEKVPKWEKKHHYIGYEMIYGKNSRTNLHHVVVFECMNEGGSSLESTMEQYVGHPGYECYTPNMPDHFFLCERYLITWAIGSEGDMAPDIAGFPLGEKHGGATYFLFQSHYDNQHIEPDVTVEWDMNIYYTDKLRELDAGTMTLGHTLLFSLTVPPRSPSWQLTGHCSSACTSASIPPQGINVFIAFLHAHYAAKSLRLRHFRGSEELPPIAEDFNFAADFQQSRRLYKEVKLLPGDHLTVECNYDSRNRNNSTFAGWGARDEMCSSFLSYYPRIDMSLCQSSPNVQVINDNFRLSGFPKDMNVGDLYVFDPKMVDGRRYQEAVNALPWDSLDHQKINTRITQADQLIRCQYNYGQLVKLDTNMTRYPKTTQYVSPEDKTCSYIHGSSGQTEMNSYGQRTTQTNGLVLGNILLVVLVSLCTKDMSP